MQAGSRTHPPSARPLPTRTQRLHPQRTLCRCGIDMSHGAGALGWGPGPQHPLSPPPPLQAPRPTPMRSSTGAAYRGGPTRDVLEGGEGGGGHDRPSTQP